MEHPQRKPNRLSDYYYDQNGAYFITICTQDRSRILSQINVGTGVLDCPLSVQKGQSGTPVPTSGNKTDNRNSTVSKFVSTFKRFCNKEYGENIWQGRYYDHVIRDQQDYDEIWEYIENNPRQWAIQKRRHE